MGRLRGNPAMRDFLQDKIFDFDHGKSFFIHISSLVALFGKLK